MSRYDPVHCSQQPVQLHGSCSIDAPSVGKATHVMKLQRLLIVVLLVQSPIVWSQCAPGIPGAGNPGCMPPTDPGSPYGQPSDLGPSPPLPPQQVWKQQWGSVAMDFDNGSSGSVADSPTKERASRSAVMDCEEQGGKHCETILVFENQCAAIAQSPNGVISTATAAKKPEAESRVLAKCTERTTCTVIYSQCAFPVRVQ